MRSFLGRLILFMSGIFSFSAPYFSPVYAVDLSPTAQCWVDSQADPQQRSDILALIKGDPMNVTVNELEARLAIHLTNAPNDWRFFTTKKDRDGKMTRMSIRMPQFNPAALRDEKRKKEFVTYICSTSFSMVPTDICVHGYYEKEK